MDDASHVAAPTIRAQRGRLTFHHSRPGAADRIQQNEGNNCDVAGCGQTRRGFGRLCRKHSKHNEKVGHPTAPSVRRDHWLPYVIEASAFVEQQLRREHPSISAGVQWCAGELLAQRVLPRQANTTRPQTGYALALARMRRNGVEAAELLSRFIAARFLLEWEETGIFKSGDHWQHQTGRLLLLSSPLRPPGWILRQREEAPADEPRSVGPRVRLFAFDQASAALGLLAVRSADELMRRFKAKADGAPIPQCVAGERVAFSP